MTSSLYISITEPNSGKSIITLGILELILRKTFKVGFFRPIIQEESQRKKDRHIDCLINHFQLPQSYQESYGVTYAEVNQLMGQKKIDDILEKIIVKYKKLEQKCEFILCEGSDYLGESSAFEFDLNIEIAKNLGCPILILGNAYQNSLDDALAPIQVAVNAYREQHCQIVGIIINKVTKSLVQLLKKNLEQEYKDSGYLLAVIPYSKRLASPRVREVVALLQAQVLYGHSQLDNLVFGYLVAAMQMQHAIPQFRVNDLIVTPSDRGDIIIGAIQAHQSTNYPNLAGIVLTTEYPLDTSIRTLIEGLGETLPILWVSSYTYETASRLQSMNSSISAGDKEKINWSIELFEKYVDWTELEKQISTIRVQGMTPKRFTYNLVQQAKWQKKHIVLPEGKEPRILAASAVLLSREIVDITLLGRPSDIEKTIRNNGINLDINNLKIINPVESENFEYYAQSLYEVRKHKGMTLDAAKDLLADVSYFGTMMVYQGDADGMVSGAVHTTQHTIRPALQIIKTEPDCSIVSSVFFMCLSDEVLVYGDCAVNPNPNAEQLAEIAISSALTAKRFGIDPRIALLSYSSGESGVGVEVEKVRQATQIAKQRRPDLKLEGPIQYDAAVDKAVGAQKMPGSEVAGQANVFIFPDLNTGNNTYKAVQRETGAIAIGPILQGLRKPVNDLSRGCTVEDIINTVVITAIQAQSLNCD
ncbi:phosphate acetyltransferase [Gloeothece citriformis PCC 7424]|uniref:Phosphate acetyltransferase n=1 Tax=Gloeothece citriformis (strain PCC 7424) TaxID=65393 RepID=B7KD45_GLOC7|nr:phosphate acetyltransferase [Gloeothece citriformis]ACK73166.1 phosphate acetyltransferase [Gloeothece citriformis PCC 7424]